MANVNYMGAPQAPANGWQPKGFLGGATWYDDRKRYEDADSLASYQRGLGAVEGTAKLEDYFKDAPVRETKRLSEIATNTATASTIGDKLSEGVRKQRVDNKLAEGTLESNIAIKLTEAAKGKREEGVAKLQQGLQLSAMMMQAMGTAGPAGAAAVAEKLKGAGLDVANDPVVRMVMSAGTPQEMQQRIKTIYKALDDANSAFRAQREKDAAALKQKQVEASAQVQAANARSAGEKESEMLMNAFMEEVKEKNPNLTPTQVRARAGELYAQRKYGVAKSMQPGAVAGDKANAEAAAKLRRQAAMLAGFNPVEAARLLEEARKLDGLVSSPVLNSGGAGAGTLKTGDTLPDGSILIK